MAKIRSSFLIYKVLISLFLSIIMVGSQKKENVPTLSDFCHEAAEFLPILVEIIGYHTLNSSVDVISKDGMQILLRFNLLRWGSRVR
ncbi:hypothetical protein ACB092_05G274400 [Castanea dentata]